MVVCKNIDFKDQRVLGPILLKLKQYFLHVCCSPFLYEGNANCDWLIQVYRSLLVVKTSRGKKLILTRRQMQNIEPISFRQK